ncbi:MAG: ROK family protein [Planctomycetes bacterium]|nr:ROK family protein [Planctomycetota bacterium]
MARLTTHATFPRRRALNGGTALRNSILAIDIGGTGLKATVIDASGGFLADRVRVETPIGAPPREIVRILADLAHQLPAYDCISVGFPGVVRNGIIKTAANLGHDGWIGYDLAVALREVLGCPVRVMNDADLQGLGAIGGEGVEIVITLGTGFGTGIYLNGSVGPHLELAHHPFRKGETYEEQLGNAARKDIGNERWNRRVSKAIVQLRELLHFDMLYIGGGNAKHLELEASADVKIVSNSAGLSGGAKLWANG